MHRAVFMKALRALKGLLERFGEWHEADVVRRALSGDDEDLREFLESNELWGGSGSIADQSGYSQGEAGRRAIRAVLIELGMKQLGEGIANVRTRSWVDAFVDWQQEAD